MEQIKYLAAFFDEEESVKIRKINSDRRLEKEITNLHVTFKYKPDYIDTRLLGTEIDFDIIGYGNNGKNEAVLLKACQISDNLKELYNEITIPHITLSRSLDSRSVYSKDLEFQPLDNPIRVTGTLGVVTDDGNVHFS